MTNSAAIAWNLKTKEFMETYNEYVGCLPQKVINGSRFKKLNDLITECSNMVFKHVQLFPDDPGFVVEAFDNMKEILNTAIKELPK